MASLTAKSLQGGSLARVMSARMLEDAALRKRFESACKKPDSKVLAAYAKAYGWTPPAELAEWEGAAPGYQAVFESVSDVWMIGGSLAYALKPLKIDNLVNDLDGLVTLLTGLERFGNDPSGDTCFVATLPHPKDVAEVHVFDHENGELDGALYYSLADFVYTCWGEPDDDVVGPFNKAMKAARAKLGATGEARALFARMKWMWSLPTGEPGYRFAEDMARAPGFATWESEKKLVGKSSVLANYWMLAHYFLGNDAACREAVALAAKASGTLTPALAKIVGALVASPAKAKLGKVGPDVLAELRAGVRKNADEKLLEPGARVAVAAARAGAGPKADPKALTARLAAGEDGWTLVAEFPDDVAAHDAILAAMAKRDDKLAEVVKRYQRQRAEDDVWDAWPSKWDRRANGFSFERRLSPCIGAAFRAGLQFDASHQRAAASLVNTLAFLDDDVAMDAFAAAIEACRMDDERLKYVVAALGWSKHPRATAIQNRAAWRFFDFFDATKKSVDKIKAEGPTLDNMFRVPSHLLPAVMLSIARGDDESEKLVDKVLSITTNMTVLGAAYATAFRQVGQKQLARHATFVAGYTKSVLAMRGECLSGAMHYNLAEAALAFAKLDPANAEPLLRAALANDNENLQMRLDLAGGALAGLLYLAPADPDILAWTERILGNRTNHERVFGALRGIAEAKVAAAREWVRFHLYVGCSSNHIGEHPAIHRAARGALVALGEPEPPPFDSETDEFANERADSEMAAALREPHHHQIDAVFKKIVKRELRSAEIVRAGGEILRDMYRFSDDDDDRASCNERKEGLACMIFQGAPALPELATLLELPHIAGTDKTIVLYVMSVIANAPELLARLASASASEVLAALRPTPESMGVLDLACGWAFATLGERARDAIEQVFRWRFAMIPPAYDHWIDSEPTAGRLARVATRLPGGERLLDELAGRGNYHVAELVKLARATTPAIEGMGGANERTLVQFMKTESYGPRYTCTITVTGASVAIAWTGTDLVCAGIIPDRGYQQRATITAASPDAAGMIADTACRALGAVGFAVPEPPRPPKASKRKSRK